MALTKVTTGVIADDAVTTTQIDDATIVTGDIAATTITSGNMAVDPTNASNLSSGSVPLAQLGNAPATDLSPLEYEMALLAFKTQANGNLARYNLIDQSVDSFEDASGVDAGGSTNEIRDSSGKYYSGSATIAIAAFTTVETTTWTPTTTGDAEILVVAGGGGGGGAQGGQPDYSGGGGGGGVVHATAYPVTAGVEYDLTIGDGGAGSNNTSNTAGDDTTFNNNNEGSQTKITADGGGRGAAHNAVGGNGGSGGGSGSGHGPSSTATQGNSGGGTGYGNAGSSGGGGGAGAGNSGRTGGIGKEFTTFEAWGTNSSNLKPTADGVGTGKGYFAGGGGMANTGLGGAGGGGDPPTSTNQNPAQPALDTTGGGGAAGWNEQGTPGGSGIILIQPPPAFNNMTLVSTAQTAASEPATVDMVMQYTNGVGTASLNVDLKAYVSRDNGTTYTPGTLVSQGTTAGQEIVTFSELSVASQPSGTAMRWKIETLNQSASKGTRINAVSLGWS